MSRSWCGATAPSSTPRAAGAQSEPQVCLAVDLFEVVAEIAGLDLERSDQAREAMQLADAVQTDLARV